jgi:hypothetical protein
MRLVLQYHELLASQQYKELAGMWVKYIINTGTALVVIWQATGLE